MIRDDIPERYKMVGYEMEVLILPLTPEPNAQMAFHQMKIKINVLPTEEMV